MKQREPAIRITTTELLGADEVVVDESGQSLALTELGLPLSRFLLAGKYGGRSDENERILIRVSDYFNDMTLVVGNYFSESLEIFEEISVEDPVVIVGKISLSTAQNQISKRFYLEEIRKASETEMRYFQALAVAFLKERIEKIAKVISSGMRDRQELSALMGSYRLGFGLSKRFELKGSIDVEKFLNLVSSFTERLSRKNRQIVLDEIKESKEISLEELVHRLEGKMSRENIEEELGNLLNDGELMEVRTGVYRYIS
ncbi:MAG: hypothetical protein QW100_00415 [Thermoplasmatales archaeon]